MGKYSGAGSGGGSLTDAQAERLVDRAKLDAANMPDFARRLDPVEDMLKGAKPFVVVDDLDVVDKKQGTIPPSFTEQQYRDQLLAERRTGDLEQQFGPLVRGINEGADPVFEPKDTDPVETVQDPDIFVTSPIKEQGLDDSPIQREESLRNRDKLLDSQVRLDGFTRNYQFSPASKVLGRLDNALDFLSKVGNFSGLSSPYGTSAEGFLSQYPQWVTTDNKGQATIQLDTNEKRLAHARYISELPGSLRAGLLSMDALKRTDSDVLMPVLPVKVTDSQGVTQEFERAGPPLPKQNISIKPELVKILLLHAEEAISSSQYADINSDKEFLSEPELIKYKDNKFIAKNRSSGIIGRTAYRQYMLNRGVPDEDIKIVPEEAITLGDFAQELFYSIHGQTKTPLVERIDATVTRDKTIKSPVRFTLTATGNAALNDPKSRNMRRFLLGGNFVDVNTDDTTTSQDAFRGSRKGYRFSKIAEEARINFSSIYFKVNNVNLKMLHEILIPFLRLSKDGKNYYDIYKRLNESQLWKLEAVDLGPERVKLIEYSIDEQKAKQYQNKKKGLPALRVPTIEEEYDAHVLERIGVLKGLVMSRDMAFKFDTAVQTFSGRLDILTTIVDPQAHKIARGAMANTNIYPIKKGTKAEDLLRQMFALEFSLGSTPYIAEEEGKLVKTKLKTDALLLAERDRNLSVYSDTYEKWGDRIIEIFKLNEDYKEDLYNMNEALDPSNLVLGQGHFSQLIKNPVFSPQNINIPKLDIDNDLDASLIKVIEEKSLDGSAIAFMKQLSEYSKYMKWKRSSDDSPFYATVTTHLDGKTSGAAIIGALLGNLDTLYKVGVIRSQGISVLDDGDLRDQIINTLIERLHAVPTTDWDYSNYNFRGNNGGPSVDGNHNVPFTDIENIYNEIIRNRDMAKEVIMTGPYGKEFLSYLGDVRTFMKLKYRDLKSKGEPHPYIVSYENLERTKNLFQTSEIIHEKYMEAYDTILTDNVREMKSILRSTILGYQIMNLPELSFKSADGSTLSVTMNETLGWEGATPKTYDVVRSASRQGEDASGITFDKITLGQYENRSTLTARDPTEIDPETGVNTSFAGDALHSSILAKIVHGIDAAIVNTFLSSKSWQELKHNAGGNPFLIMVYDAVYVDIGTFDTAMKNINKAFTDIIENYDPFQKILNSLESEYKIFLKEIQSKNPKEVLTDDDKRFFLDLFSFNPDRPDNSRYLDKKLGDFAKFSKTSRFRKNVNSYKSKNTGWLSKGGNAWNEESTLTQLENVIYNGKYNFDIKDPKYNITVNALDYEFLQQVIPLYFEFLFGKGFSRFRTFATEAHINKKKSFRKVKELNLPNYQYQ